MRTADALTELGRRARVRARSAFARVAGVVAEGSGPSQGSARLNRPRARYPCDDGRPASPRPCRPRCGVEDRRDGRRRHRRGRLPAELVDEEGRRVLQARRRGDGERRRLAQQEAAGARQRRRRLDRAGQGHAALPLQDREPRAAPATPSSPRPTRAWSPTRSRRAPRWSPRARSAPTTSSPSSPTASWPSARRSTTRTRTRRPRSRYHPASQQDQIEQRLSRSSRGQGPPRVPRCIAARRRRAGGWRAATGRSSPGSRSRASPRRPRRSRRRRSAPAAGR